MFKTISAGWRNHKIWLFFFVLMVILFAVFLWLAEPRSFYALLGAMILGCSLLLAGALLYSARNDDKRYKALMTFLEDPTQMHESEAQRLSSPGEQAVIHAAGIKLGKNRQEIYNLSLRLNEYEEYAETWAHEIKTPLSLMTFLLDNRRDELPAPLYHKLEYIRNQLQEDVDQMLYYGRLKSDHKDYLFEKLLLSECCSDVLDEYRILLEEKNFQINTDLADLTVLSDRKGLEFILRQILSNTVKYARPEEKSPLLSITAYMDENKTHVLLCIKDNGIGVRPHDLPFIFEKGYTGETGSQRKKATGMGLYLLRQMADDLKIEVEVSSAGQSFEIKLIFPAV